MRNQVNINSNNEFLSKVNIHYNDNVPANIVDSGTCGDNVNWTLDDEGTLTISGEGEMYRMSSPFIKNTAIKRVIIEEVVTSIGNEGFA